MAQYPSMRMSAPCHCLLADAYLSACPCLGCAWLPLLDFEDGPRFDPHPLPSSCSIHSLSSLPPQAPRGIATTARPFFETPLVTPARGSLELFLPQSAIPENNSFSSLPSTGPNVTSFAVVFFLDCSIELPTATPTLTAQLLISTAIACRCLSSLSLSSPIDSTSESTSPPEHSTSHGGVSISRCLQGLLSLRPFPLPTPTMRLCARFTIRMAPVAESAALA